MDVVELTQHLTERADELGWKIEEWSRLDSVEGYEYYQAWFMRKAEDVNE